MEDLRAAKSTDFLYGRLYAQPDQPQKVTFKINALEVYGLL